MKPKYLLLTFLLLSTASIFSSAGTEVLLLRGFEAAAHDRIGLPAREKATVTLFTDYVRVNYLYRAFLVLQLLSERRVEHKFHQLLEPVLLTNNPLFIRCFFETIIGHLTPERLCTAFYISLHDGCSEAESIVLELYKPHLSSKELSDLHHNALTFASYQGDTKKVKAEIDWLMSVRRNLDASPLQGVSAHRNFSNENKKESTGSRLVGEHSLPLNAAAEVSEIDTVDLLLQAGASPSAKDLKGESALALLRRKLDRLDAMKPYLLTTELSDLWQEERDRTRDTLQRLEIFSIMAATRERTKDSKQLQEKTLRRYNLTLDKEGVPTIIALIRKAPLDSSKDSYQTKAAVALKLCPALAKASIRDNQGNNILHAAVEAKNSYLCELIVALNPSLLLIPNAENCTAADSGLAECNAVPGLCNALWGMVAIKDELQESVMLKKAIEGGFCAAIQCILLKQRDLCTAIPRNSHTSGNNGEPNIARYALCYNQGTLETVVKVAKDLEQRDMNNSTLGGVSKTATHETKATRSNMHIKSESIIPSWKAFSHLVGWANHAHYQEKTRTLMQPSKENTSKNGEFLDSSAVSILIDTLVKSVGKLLFFSK